MEKFEFEEEFQDNEEINQFNKSILSDDDLNELVEEQKEIDAKTLYSKVASSLEEQENNVIKSNDLSTEITGYELETLLNYKNDRRQKDFYVSSMDEDDMNIDEQFDDFLQLPKISGKNTSLIESNLIPETNISKSHKFVEIKDQEANADGHHTSIEINRDEDNEIESIVIYCQCGEKTLIRFDYSAEDNLSSSEVSPKTKVSSFSLEEVEIKNIDEKKS